jgi:hypothetical protein
MRNKRIRPVAVFGALAVNDLLDETGVGDDDRCSGAEFERVQAAVLGGPFCESAVVSGKTEKNDTKRDQLNRMI